MSETEVKTEKKAMDQRKSYRFRARLPEMIRFAAAVSIALLLVVIGIGFYRGSFTEEFRMKGLKELKLSDKKIGEVTGYERRETENGVPKYFVKADKAATFSDQHQEFENVYLQLFYDGNEQIYDQIEANRAIYVPAGDGTNDFKIFFAGDVNVATRDNLKVQGDQLSFDNKTKIAQSEFEVEFTRDNVSGSSYGAVVDVGNETLQLLKDVEIYAYANGGKTEIDRADLQNARINSDYAFVDQKKEIVEFSNSVKIELTPKRSGTGLKQDTDIAADRAKAYFKDREIRNLELTGSVFIYQKPSNGISDWSKIRASKAVAKINQGLESVVLDSNVSIETTANSTDPSIIHAQKALYNATTDSYELAGAVKIETSKDSKPTAISANDVRYREAAGKIRLEGNAQVVQGNDLVKGNVIDAVLYPDQSLKSAVVSGSAYLRQRTNERTTEVFSDQMFANVDENGKIRSARAVGNARTVVIPGNTKEFSRYSMAASNAIDLKFRADGTLDLMQTEGRTSIALNSPNNSPDSSNKTLSADRIETALNPAGTELLSATAKGNAELEVKPLRAARGNFNSVVRADRFDCDFFKKNSAKSCVTSGRTTVVREPLVVDQNRQTLAANRLNATFDERSQDIKTFDATGNAKFTEGDRNGTAEKINYTAGDSIVRFRGGDPTIWDSNARARSNSIDWDTRNDRSTLTGGVSTTYYSQKKSGGVTPFGSTNSPVYLTADQANFDHKSESALYSGNARAWQDNNYVRSDRMKIQREQGKFYAEGNVQSLLYDVNRTVGGRTSKQPVYASADKMLYTQNDNMIRYEDHVDIRQGTDRITANAANVYLTKDYELARTDFEGNIRISQPGRNASGTFAEYNASNETILLRGNPASVSDSERGATQSPQITVYLKDNRVVSSGSTEKSNGRLRTVYKIKNGKLN